ncbi:MAG: hypothetical protein V2I57_09900 [Xanthomonadales bacterium]|jgi:hypothetical protein|nr:hypothetical protein [Xanthomonadales bacterium]
MSLTRTGIRFILIVLFLLGCCAAGGFAFAEAPPPLERREDMPTATQAEAEWSGAEIIRRAHEAAGGETFVRPGSLFLSGYNIIRSPDGGEKLWDRYAMWRVFAEEKPDAHQASGQVRIEAWSGDELALLLAYDGEHTWNQDGRMEDQGANAMWSANFGFGAIRNALDEGWTQARRPDDLIDGQPAFLVELTDPSGGETLFGFRQSDFAILYVGFDTPRGWHERRYSHFFSLPGSDWIQAGRVRLFYDGIKANEAVWTHFAVGERYAPSLFQVNEPPVEPGWTSSP